MIGHKTNLSKHSVSYWTSKAPSANGEYVLLIHGFGGNYNGMEELAKLIGKHYGIIGIDLPGYGSSEPMARRHNLRNYADFINRLCRHIGVTKLHIVGHSFGADIALVLAARHPALVDKLVLLHPVIGTNKVIKWFSRAYYSFVAVLPRPIRHQVLHNHATTWLSDTFMFRQADDKRRQRILRDDYISDHLMTDSPTIEGYQSVLTTPFFSYGQKIKAKTIIISGDQDPLSPVDVMSKLANSINGSDLVVVPKAGHFYPLEKPIHASNRILDFLKN